MENEKILVELVELAKKIEKRMNPDHVELEDFEGPSMTRAKAAETITFGFFSECDTTAGRRAILSHFYLIIKNLPRRHIEEIVRVQNMLFCSDH